MKLNKKTSREDIKEVLMELDGSFKLSFYDAYYKLRPEETPIPYGDTGAFTDIIKNKSGYQVNRGNHGWTRFWQPIGEFEIIERIYESREFNEERIFSNPRITRKEWKKTDNGVELYYYQHETSD